MWRPRPDLGCWAPPKSAVGRDSLVGLATCHGDRIPPGGEIFPATQSGPEAHTAFLTMRTGSFLDGKTTGARC